MMKIFQRGLAGSHIEYVRFQHIFSEEFVGHVGEIYTNDSKGVSENRFDQHSYNYVVTSSNNN